MKFLFFVVFTFINLSAQVILISQKNINYKELINKSDLGYVKSDKKQKCKPFNIKLLDKDAYQAKHFIFKGKAICLKNLIKVEENKIEYDFGNIVIQRSGKVISENKDYLKIKNYDGSIQKIYKNGQH